MIGARVVEALVFSKFLLNVGRSLVDGEDDSAGGGIGLLPDVDGIGGKTHNYDLLVSSGSVSTGPEPRLPKGLPGSGSLADHSNYRTCTIPPIRGNSDHRTHSR